MSLLLKSPLSQSVSQVNFTDMNIERATNCEYDFVEIFNGGLVSSPSFGKFCGSNLSQPLTSQGNELRIEFHSDDTESAPGFRLEYRFITEGVYIDSCIHRSTPVNLICCVQEAIIMISRWSDYPVPCLIYSGLIIYG